MPVCSSYMRIQQCVQQRSHQLHTTSNKYFLGLESQNIFITLSGLFFISTLSAKPGYEHTILPSAPPLTLGYQSLQKPNEDLGSEEYQDPDKIKSSIGIAGQASIQCKWQIRLLSKILTRMDSVQSKAMLSQHVAKMLVCIP